MELHACEKIATETVVPLPPQKNGGLVLHRTRN